MLGWLGAERQGRQGRQGEADEAEEAASGIKGHREAFRPIISNLESFSHNRSSPRDPPDLTAAPAKNVVATRVLPWSPPLKRICW